MHNGNLGAWRKRLCYNISMKKVYNKLVRDKMIDIYEHDVANKVSASDYVVRYLSPEEIIEKLKDKFVEETQEVVESYEDKSQLKEEIADVMEVIDAILFHHHIELSEIINIRDAKKAKRGGFEKGLYLESIDFLDETK